MSCSAYEAVSVARVSWRRLKCCDEKLDDYFAGGDRVAYPHQPLDDEEGGPPIRRRSCNCHRKLASSRFRRNRGKCSHRGSITHRDRNREHHQYHQGLIAASDTPGIGHRHHARSIFLLLLSARSATEMLPLRLALHPPTTQECPLVHALRSKSRRAAGKGHTRACSGSSSAR